MEAAVALGVAAAIMEAVKAALVAVALGAEVLVDSARAVAAVASRRIWKKSFARGRSA